MATLSIITLTRNRLDKLRRLIDRVFPELGPGDEILLIDTGSTDGTRELLDALNHPAIRSLHYDGPGSWAEMRNFGVAHAHGELIAFLDDDCLPDPGWIARGKAALAEADAVGGMVRPHGITYFPEWWHPEMGWMVGLSVPGQIGPDAGRVHYPFTANVWARTAVCRAVPFQEIGGGMGGEETGRYRTGREDAQWWRTLRTMGWRTRFDPALGVGHAIDPARLDLDYLRRRARLDGRAWAVREGTAADLEPLAYQWWRQLFMAMGAVFADEDERRCHWHCHRLTFERHGAALRGLEEKIFNRVNAECGMRNAELISSNPQSAIQVRNPSETSRLQSTWLRRLVKPWMFRGLGRLAWDFTKSRIRGAVGPMLRARPRRRQPVNLERVAVIAFGYLGDMVILQSALRGLMRAHPWLEVYVVAPAQHAHVLRDVRRLNVTPTPELNPRSAAAREWLESWLERLDPDVIYAPYLHEPWGRVLTGIRRPPRPVYGFDHDQGLRRMIWMERLGMRVRKNLEFHEARNLCALFDAGGLACEPAPAELTPAPQALEAATADPWLAARIEAGTPVVMLNPDAAHRQKEWTEEAWAEFVELTLERTGAALVFNASRPHPELEELAAKAPERLHVLQQAPIPDLVAWLSRCAALVTVDSGPQHLAHALGVPSVTLYGPMDERRWHDLFQRGLHRTVRACPWDLTPDERRSLPVGHEVAQIRAEAVIEELMKVSEMRNAECGMRNNERGDQVKS